MKKQVKVNVYVVLKDETLVIEVAKTAKENLEKGAFFVQLYGQFVVVSRGGWANNINWAGFETKLAAEEFIRKMSQRPAYRSSDK